MKILSKLVIYGMLGLFPMATFALVTKVVGGGVEDISLQPGTKVAVTLSASLLNPTTFEAEGLATGVGLGTFPLNGKITVNCLNASQTAAIISGTADGISATGESLTKVPVIFGVVYHEPSSETKKDLFSITAFYDANDPSIKTCKDFPTPTSAADIANVMEVVYGLDPGAGTSFLNPLTGNITIK